MRRRIASVIALVTVTVFLVSCGDASRTTNPTSPIRPENGRLNSTTATCLTYTQLVALVNDVFGAGSPNANSALGKLDNLNKQIQKGNVADAQAQAMNIVSFIQQKAQAGGLPGTHAQVQALISGVLCFAGLSPDTFLIFPSDNAQILRHSGGKSGVSFQANTVNEPTLITIELLPTNTPPLDTKLDQYPGFIHITQSSPLTKPAIVGVCPASSVPLAVITRLRLGHQTPSGVVITPDADASFLDCSGSTAAAPSRIPGWVQRLASIFAPKPLYAKTMMFGGGVGGLVTEFSPFAPVDDELSFKGGAGATVTEFDIRRDTTATSRTPKLAGEGSSVNTVVNGVCTQINAVVGSAVENECRPFVTIQTYQGTVLQNVPITWATGQNGGVVAPEATPAHTCGVFGAGASTITNANGFTSICWTLGSTPGTDTVIATPAAGGDAPAGVTFSRQSIKFTASALQITPTATATGGVFPYDGLPHAGSGACSHGLTPALTYTGGTPPTNAGTYTLTVTCGAGNPLYVTVNQTATIQIDPAATTANVICATSVTYTGSPQTPCTGSVTGPGLSLTVAPTYTSNIVGTATATVTYAGGGNYAPSSASKTFKILYAQSGCFASPIYNVMPSTKSFQNRGSNVPVKCTLLTASGSGVSNATGSILVQDMGANGLATPSTVVSVANAFKATNSGNYAYGLDTSPSGFVSTHYYRVTATWSDGSTTMGWFYIK